MDSELGPLRFGLIGAGRVGRALGRALLAADLEVVGYASPTQASRDAVVAELGVAAFAASDDLTPHVDVVITCVPDRHLGDVIASVASAGHRAGRGRLVVTSGVVSRAELGPAIDRGWDVVVMQPLASILGQPEADAAALVGAPAIISAEDVAGQVFGHALAHALRLVPVDVPAIHRPLVGAAAAMAANLPLGLLDLAHHAMIEAGIPDAIARGTVARLAERATGRWAASTTGEALAGPIPRGDTTSVERHLAALDRASTVGADAYRLLGQHLVATAHGTGRIDVHLAHELSSALSEAPSED